MTDYTYSLGICYTGLEDVTWGVPQWLTHASQGETLVAVQPLRRDVTAVKFWNWRPGGFLKSCWLSVYTGLLKKPHLTPTTTGNEGTYQSRGEASKPKATFFLGPLLKMWASTRRQKAWLRFRVGRPATNDLIKKIPPRSAQRLRFLLIPDVVNLTGKITITNLYQRTCKCFFFLQNVFGWNPLCKTVVGIQWPLLYQCLNERCEQTLSYPDIVVKSKLQGIHS